MTVYLRTLLLEVIRPTHDGLHTEFGIPASDEADCLSLAIKVQETGQTAVRDQGDPNITGPATGLWQFEKTGGVWEILNAPKIAPIFRELCDRAGVRANDDAVWRFFTTPQSDELAAAAARLVMYLDPAPLPPVSQSAADVALAYYLRRWRPAANPKRENDFTSKAWPQAVEIVLANRRDGLSGARPVPAEPVLPPSAAPSSPSALEARVAALEATLERVRAALR